MRSVHIPFAACVAMLILLLAGPVRAADIQFDHVDNEILIRFHENVATFERDDVLVRMGAATAEPRPTLGYEKITLRAGESVGAVIERLENDPAVAWIEPNWIGYALACSDCPQDPHLVDTPDVDNQWGIHRTGVQNLWKAGASGAGLTIAIVDSGLLDFVDPHSDLKLNVLFLGADFIDDDFNPTDAGASAGHGTAVAAVAAATSDERGMAGVAYCSSLLIVRVLDCAAGASCPGTADNVSVGIAWAAENGADIINLSLGFDAPSTAVHAALVYARSLSAIIVAASGNSGSAGLKFPASDPLALAVGSSTSADAVASSSTYGPGLDVVAPGDAVRTAGAGDGYTTKSGTSFAAPFVSGVAALLLQNNAGMTQLEIQDYLRRTAVDIGGGATQGFGRVDLGPTADWSDFTGPAEHRNSSWEWLGLAVTTESSSADPDDSDGFPNASPDGDLADSGFQYLGLPWLPPILDADPDSTEVGVSVCNHAGPRYVDGRIYLDMWADWNSDGFFDPSEYAITAREEDPSTWGADEWFIGEPVVATEVHILGNPLRSRFRLSYGAPSLDPYSSEPYGEVEDMSFINFVEGFDGDFAEWFMSGWGPSPDPNEFFFNHGRGFFASAPHPLEAPCDGGLTAIVMSTPSMDWTEYTDAYLSFVFWHGFSPCGAGDACRVELHVGGVMVDVIPIPAGGGPIFFDASEYTGVLSSDVVFHFIAETDSPGTILIDDVIVVAFDDVEPDSTTDLMASRPAASNEIDLVWTSANENVGGTPPLEPTPAGYLIRYSDEAIVSDADWAAATPVLPRDVVGGGGLPVALPFGAPAAISFVVPSALADYYVALRTGGEESFLSAAAGTDVVPATPTHGLSVDAADPVTGAPGEIVDLSFRVTNIGSHDETVILAAAGVIHMWEPFITTLGYDIPTEAIARLGAGASLMVVVSTEIPDTSSAGVIETIDLFATSADSPAGSVASGTIEVDASSDVPEVGTTPVLAGLSVSGPNPFREDTTFELALTRAQPAQLQIFDVGGHLVRTLVDGSMDVGVHQVLWDGTNSNGKAMQNGIYFLRVQTEEVSAVKRLVRVR